MSLFLVYFFLPLIPQAILISGSCRTGKQQIGALTEMSLRFNACRSLPMHYPTGFTQLSYIHFPFLFLFLYFYIFIFIFLYFYLLFLLLFYFYFILFFYIFIYLFLYFIFLFLFLFFFIFFYFSRMTPGSNHLLVFY